VVCETAELEVAAAEPAGVLSAAAVASIGHGLLPAPLWRLAAQKAYLGDDERRLCGLVARHHLTALELAVDSQVSVGSD